MKEDNNEVYNFQSLIDENAELKEEINRLHIEIGKLRSQLMDMGGNDTSHIDRSAPSRGDFVPLKDYEDMCERATLAENIVQSLPVYLFVKDVNDDFRYVVWNKAFEEHSKIPASAVIGNTDYDFFPNYDDAVKFRNDDMEVVKSRKPITRHETYEAADGKTRIVLTVKTLGYRKNKGPLLIGFSWDITNINEIEKEMLNDFRRIEESGRQKSAFLANMSHEIRTPLNAIVGFADLLATTDVEGDKKMFRNIIQQNSETLLQLINDILDISKIEAGTLEYNRQPIDLNQLFYRIYETNKGRTQEDVCLIYDNSHSSHKLMINEDPNRITQVVTNLINNAIKFTKQGYIRFGYEINPENIEVYVKDTGIGIPRDKLGSVFDRFKKLNSNAKGTGLGLAICKLIIELIGGTISVDSDEGQGSIFRFTIPFISNQEHIRWLNGEECQSVQERADAATEAKMPEALPVEQPVEEKKTTILVGEDTESNFILLKVLIGKKFRLLWAHDGEEAIRMFQKEKPDLILMDLKMPKVDGLEATRRIRMESNDVPIVAVTAFAFESDRRRALEAGMNDFMTKPVTMGALQRILTKYLKAEI